MNDVDDEVRELLWRKAHDVPPHLEVPGSLTTRVRRRIALNALAVTTTLVVVAAGVVGTVRAFRPTPSTGPFSSGTITECTSAHLRAVASFGGAAGSREGTIDLTNLSETCTLQGTPALRLLDEHLDPIASGITFVPAAAGWEVNGSPRPEGWPVVTLAPAGTASVRVRWSNWCPDGSAIPVWRVAIPDGGDVDVEGLDAMSVPPCNGPGQPSTIEVGPFEPPLES